MRTDETQRSENVRVVVVVAHEASELEHFAAEQLCNYLQQLFRIQTSPTHNIPSDAEALLLISCIDLLSAAERERFAQVSEQGIFLQYLQSHKNRPFSCPALLIGGGNPRATLWAVYELVQRSLPAMHERNHKPLGTAT